MIEHPFVRKICTGVVSILLVTYISEAQPSEESIELSAIQAVEMAMKSNHTLKSLDHQVKGSSYNVRNAVANFLPELSLNGTYTRLGLDRDEMSPFFGPASDNSYSVGFKVQQPIFTGFALLNGLRSARASHSLMESGNEKTQQLIQYGVLQIYWGLVNLQKSEIVASEAIRQLEELTANQSALKDQGMATEHDYLLTKASLAQARMSELEVKKTVSSMKRQFAVLLGVPVSSDIILTDTNTSRLSGVPSDLDSIITTAAQTRPDLKELHLQTQISEFGIKSAQASLYPTIAAGFSYSNARPDQMYRDQWGDSWNAFAAINFTLWDWGKRINQIKQAREQLHSLEELVREKKAMVEKEALDAFYDVKQSSQELEVAHQLVEARKAAYDASGAKYEEGVIPMYELLDSHSAYISAKFKALQAATNLELAVINLAMGGIGYSASLK